MLVEDFYHITELIKHEDALDAEIKLNADHEVYKGHFPERPVVPGVIQLQVIKEVLENVLGIDLMIREIVVAKYLRPVTPGENLFLQIRIDYKQGETGEYLINARVTKNDTTFTKLKATLSKSTIRR
ncbi:MAG: hydroxymyristoyl-ACP dehydratase [Bacteroidetes bacterium]|nr:hydroxymyristoyl-ACP dehydratase [Bacteroidota bacterium]